MVEFVGNIIYLSFQRNINLSIISPRKIPILLKIFEKADGDMSVLNKGFSKDPRHLVLLKGYWYKNIPKRFSFEIVKSFYVIILDLFCSFSDRPSTPQTSAPQTPTANILNANMQSPRQNNAATPKEPVPSNNMIRTNSGSKIFINFHFTLDVTL